MTIPAGSRTTATVAFAPSEEGGTVELANVTAKLRKADGTETELTPVVAGDDPNTFTVSFDIAEDDPPGIYVVRWESSTPSPRIVVEGDATSFVVEGSAFTNP